MFGFSLKLPLSDEMRDWVDSGFARLSKMLGRKRMLDAKLILPSDQFFPDPYDGSKVSVIAMADRVAGYMGVPPEAFIIEIYAENEEAWLETVPLWRGEAKDVAGLYFHKPKEG